jgi:UPF0755 protein
MKKFIVFFALIVLLVGVSLYLMNWWKVNTTSVSDDTRLQSFVIPKGRSAMEIGNKLHAEGLVKSPFAFKVYVQVTGKSKSMQAGEFRLSPSFSLFEIVDQLSKGPVELWVTIPEGLRQEEIVKKFIEGLEIDSEKAAGFRQQFLIESEEKEGYLFPDTYLFPRSASASAVVSKMTSTFDKRLNLQLQEETQTSELSLSEVVVLASIIERETKTKQERSIVAGILIKRLENDWPIQADATVQYAVASNNCKGKIDCDWWPILTREDLEIDSSHNTYKYSGLPTSPICNPGIISIKAALNPESSPYWYYIHDPEGKIHYAKTLKEHNANIVKYLK